ncbi:MAG: hypothetical protein DMF89_23290 [Acidobacteria bacterium]|nr:MAG: hypothetical protein DMF89_23290 [Acidobacteriota bacterium]
MGGAMLVFRRVWTRLVLAGALVAPLPSTVGAQSLPESAAAGTRRAAADTQDPAQAIKGEIDELKKDFNARLAALESRLAALGPAGSLPVYGGATAGSKIFNPDIAVLGNFLGAAGSNHVRPLPALQMAESEASFQAVVDPYARADFFLSFGEQGVDLEEGYITFPTLPGGLLMKVGKQRAAFGKVNTMHSHVLPWADRPLTTENLMNGEDGLSDAGISVARLIPNPWLFLEGTGQVFRGDSGSLFHSSERSDLSYVGHLRAYQDITESTNLDIGASYSHGHNASGVVDGVDVGRYTTDLYGLDATLRWRPLQRSIYHSFVGRTEVIWSRRQQPNGLQVASGVYASGDYQFARRWFAGVRFDRSDRATDDALHDQAQSLVLTYWPSEFSQIRRMPRE